MGDPMKNLEVFKRIGFDAHSQWMLYDELFDKFFTWFTDHITDDNIIEEAELFDLRTLKKSAEYLQNDDLESKLTEVKAKYPFILGYKEDDIEELSAYVTELTEAANAFSTDSKSIETSKNTVLHAINNTTSDKQLVKNSVKDLGAKCLEKAQELQDIQKTNKRLCGELNESLLKTQSPPLFIHQMPLEQYFTKCASHYHYFMLYMNENFKIQDYAEDNDDEGDTNKIGKQLEKLREQMCRAEENLLESKKKILCIKRMTADLDVDNAHLVSISQIKKEIRELITVNEHSAYTYQTLMNEIKSHIQELSQQQIESILYENGKQRLNRATEKLQKVKSLSQIVSDALLNAELLWIFMQVDSEKMKSKCDTIENLSTEQQIVQKRIDSMGHLQCQPSNIFSTAYIAKLSEVIAAHIPINKRKSFEPNLLLFEFAEFCRSTNYILNDIINKKFYKPALEVIKEIDTKRKILFNYVFDSPVNAPMFENIKFLEPIFEAEQLKKYIESVLKQLRSEYQDNIRERMNSDRFWGCKQVLWIWFLTEPKKVLSAINDVSKAASKISSVAPKCISGIKRK